ncbi:MAG: hypothetical protein WC901_00085 [Candidatus Margulisiibacteriota bacterium]
MAPASCPWGEQLDVALVPVGQFPDAMPPIEQESPATDPLASQFAPTVRFAKAKEVKFGFS